MERCPKHNMELEEIWMEKHRCENVCNECLRELDKTQPREVQER